MNNNNLIDQHDVRTVFWLNIPKHQGSPSTKRGLRPSLLIPLTVKDAFYGETNFLVIPFTTKRNKIGLLKEFIVMINLNQKSYAELFNVSSISSKYLNDHPEKIRLPKEQIITNDFQNGKISIDKLKEILDAHLNYQNEVCMLSLEQFDKKSEMTQLKEAVLSQQKTIMSQQEAIIRLEKSNEKVNESNQLLKLEVEKLVRLKS